LEAALEPFKMDEVVHSNFQSSSWSLPRLHLEELGSLSRLRWHEIGGRQALTSSLAATGEEFQWNLQGGPPSEGLSSPPDSRVHKTESRRATFVFTKPFQCVVHIVVGPCAKGHFIHVGSPSGPGVLVLLLLLHKTISQA
jgi:hypothetical protein